MAHTAHNDKSRARVLSLSLPPSLPRLLYTLTVLLFSLSAVLFALCDPLTAQDCMRYMALLMIRRRLQRTVKS